MGHELQPLSVRPANAQAQKDLESLDYFTRKWNLDAGFVRGLVIRFAKYEVHERIEKKLYECARLDLMVRKALKEKHLIDGLWPSPAPRNIAKELLQQGVQVRQFYGDMFNKYFRVLHSIDSFQLRPEVDHHIKNAGTLMLIPFVDHLIFGAVDPIMPIVARGAGYSNAERWNKKDQNTSGFGEQGKFEIRFDAPAEVTDTYTKIVVRQCQCLKCGTKRDVQVVISVDPNPDAAAVGAGGRRDTGPSASKGHTSKTAQWYSPGYQMPGERDTAPPQPPRPQREPSLQRPSTPDLKKQCPRCTFLNEPSLSACEMCEAPLPENVIQKPPSPAAVKKSNHAYSRSEPPAAQNPRQEALKAEQRPGVPNRHSLSASLFSIFPFNQQQQQEHHAKLPATQQVDTSPAVKSRLQEDRREEARLTTGEQDIPRDSSPDERQDGLSQRASTPPPASHEQEAEQRSSRHAMMPLTPSPPPSAGKRPVPAGLPSNIMDDFVPVSPAYPREDEEINAGWGEVSREEARRPDDSDEEDDEVEGRNSGGLIDLDAVAREEADVWGDRED
jgi:hypothetical protein